MSFVGFDLETYPFMQGLLRTPIVAGAFSESVNLDRTEILLREDMFPRVKDLILNQHLVGARVSFDMFRCAITWPELWPAVFDAYEEKRVHDVQIREGLINLATTGDVSKDGSLPNLGELLFKYKRMDVSAEKTGPAAYWRTNYHELEGIPPALWPEDARRYLQRDAWAAREIAKAQGTDHFDTEWLHAAADFCYEIMRSTGLDVDRKLKRRLQRKVEKELSPEALPLLYSRGLVIPAQPPQPHALGHKNHVEGCPRKACACPVKLIAAQPERVAKTEALVPLIMQICAENHLEIPMTDPKDYADSTREKFPNGQVKTDEETVAMLAGFDPCMGQYHTRIEKDKLRTSYFPAMEWPYGSGRTARKIYPGFEPLKKTGRGSSRGTSKSKHKNCSCYQGVPCANATYASQNIQQSDPRVRACYLPGRGRVYVVADFSAIDLVCLAQTLHRLFGKSALRDQINKGIEPHGYLATAIAEQKVPWFAEKIRGMSGPEEAYAYFTSLKKTKPKFYNRWRQLAKKVGLGFAGGMGIGRFIALVAKELHMKLTVNEAKALKRLWFRVYPEMKRYLDWVTKQVDGKAQGDFNLCYTSPLGMRRTACSYTECANGNALQTPAAEGMKLAMFRIARACYDPTRKDVLYGTRLAINMHDELVGKLKITTPKRMDRQARRWGELMVEGQREICPDVAVKADPFLTDRWVKDARQVRNDEGLIVPWIWGNN